MKKIKIAMVAPPFGPEGGPEVVCRHLTDALVDMGIDVTLFAPGDWETKAKHIQTLPISLWKMKNFKKQSEFFRKNLIYFSQLKIIKNQEKFDIIHLHSQRNAYVVAKFLEKPCLLTLHNIIGRMDLDQIRETKLKLVAISEGRKKMIGNSQVIENGINVKELEYSFGRGKYLLVVGRLIEQKGIDVAIKIAKKAAKKLIIIGRIGNSPKRQAYYQKKIKPFLDKNIIHKNQMPQKRVYEYMKNAEALISPIRGRLTVVPLVVMESLACGTPVISTPVKPAPAFLKNKKIGIFSANTRELIGAAKEVNRFSRAECRKFAEKYFDSHIMAEKYAKLYKKITAKK